jgi:hypothetical protein
MLSAEVVSNTTRTPNIGDITKLGEQISEVKNMAGGRASSLEFLTTYPDHTIGSKTDDTEYHREQIDLLRQAGVTWLGIPGHSTTESQTLEVIECVGKSYG